MTGDEAPSGFTFTDKRKVDPVTGEVRPPVAADVPADAAVASSPDDDRVAELTADLQRVAAEYANYRRRTEREREATRTATIAGVLSELLPVLDDIGRARSHGDLEGTFKTVGEGLESIVARLGLERYGAEGDAFDPELHEAFSHTDASTGGPTVTVVSAVYEPGYRYAGRVVRHARVAVEDRDGIAVESNTPAEAPPHVDTTL